MTAGRYRAYVIDVSYFSGTLEAYLRYKGIPHDRVETSWPHLLTRVARHTGIVKVPVVEAPGGVWLQDTTPMLDWFEARHPEPPVVPGDPLQAFVARLLEDYADEWLWRPALHYRWSFRPDALHLSRRIVDEVFRGVPVPRALLRLQLRRRQKRFYLKRDGVGPQTRAHVEATYTTALARLESCLAERPFLLGGRPCLADYGFFASMFRHFSLDPTPARIMRETAPRVYAWVARLWAARAGDALGDWEPPGRVPPAWRELLQDAAATYLPYLHANAVACREGRKRLDYTVQDVTYRDTPVVYYRAWCRERLQDHYEALPEAAKPGVRALLEETGAWEPLWRDGVVRSGLHPEGDPAVCRPPRGARAWWRLRTDSWNPRRP